MCGSVSGGVVCYSGDSVGSVAVYFCDDGYTLEGDSTRECLSTGLWNGTAPHCFETDGMSSGYIIIMCTHYSLSLENEVNSSQTDKKCTATVVGVVCSLVFLIVGVLLGVVTLYLIQRVRGRLSGPTSPSPPHLPPPANYEVVDVAEVKSQDIQLTSNESHAPLHKDNIPTSHNTAYGQVRL